eukprot:1181678-Prorocentrum_minimum.AAC.3
MWEPITGFASFACKWCDISSSSSRSPLTRGAHAMIAMGDSLSVLHVCIFAGAGVQLNAQLAGRGGGEGERAAHRAGAHSADGGAEGGAVAAHRSAARAHQAAPAGHAQPPLGGLLSPLPDQGETLKP